MVSVRILARRRLVLVNERGYAIGPDHHRTKRSDADIALVLELREAGMSYATIAAKFDDVPGGVSKSWVRDVCKGIIRAQVAVGTKRCG